MNRWNFKPTACPLAPVAARGHTLRRRWVSASLLAVTLAAFIAPNAGAQLASQTRKLPDKVKFAELLVVQPPVVKLNGKQDRLAPGARIYGTDNLLVLSGTLINKPVKVAYIKDTYGLLHQIWLLTDAEIRNAKWD